MDEKIEVNKAGKERYEISSWDEVTALALAIGQLPRSSWISKGSRKKDNENVELPRVVADELARKAGAFYATVKDFPYDPFCNCKEIEELLQRAIQELPDGDTYERLAQIVFRRCPRCGQKFEEADDEK